MFIQCFSRPPSSPPLLRNRTPEGTVTKTHGSGSGGEAESVCDGAEALSVAAAERTTESDVVVSIVDAAQACINSQKVA